MDNNKMSKNEILQNINGNGGFDNLNNWNTEEIAIWVYNNFPCTRYTARQVALNLK